MLIRFQHRQSVPATENKKSQSMRVRRFRCWPCRWATVRRSLLRYEIGLTTYDRPEILRHINQPPLGEQVR
jgi:hypothetical protein